MIYRRACDVIHDDDFLRLEDFATDVEVYVKLEGLNPAGSIKLKTARGLVQAAEHDADQFSGLSLIESTSGNLGVALAVVCSGRHNLTLVVDPNASRLAVAKAAALGAIIARVTERDQNGGYLGTRIAYIQARLANEPHLTWLNQYINPANPRAHRATTAPAVAQSFPRLDYLFVGAGTTGTLMGCVGYFKRRRGGTRIVAVDAAGSVTFGGPPSPRHIPGIGMSVAPQLLRDDGSFDKISVSEIDAIRTCRRVAQSYGLLVGGSTGSVLAAVEAYAPTVAPGSVMVAISPDGGDACLETVYCDQWVNAHYQPSFIGVA